MCEFPVRTCRSCGFKTTSTSTIDWCPKCLTQDGLRPRHFLTRQKDAEAIGRAAEALPVQGQEQKKK